MRRLLFPILVLALAAPAAAQIDEPPPLTEPHPVVEAAHHAIINFLDLDPDQVAEWDVLWADHRSAEEVLVQQIAYVQAMIEDLFATGNPDPSELGVLMIERRALGEALIDVHVVYVEGFEMLLDEEQTRRLQEIRIAEKIQKWIPAFRTFDLVRR